MTVAEQNGVLEIIVLNNGKKRMESIRGIVPTASDSDLNEIATGIAGLLSDTLSEIRRVITKSYVA